MGDDLGCLLEQLDFSLSATGQPSQNFPSTLVPFGKLSAGDLVRALAFVESLDQAGGLEVSTADIHGPGDKCSELVGVELDLVLNGAVEAFSKLNQVFLQELDAVGLGEREFVRNIFAASLEALVTVADGAKTDGVGIRFGPPAFETLD